MYDPYKDFKKSRLGNGLEVHSVFWDRPWVGMEVIVHSGAREDPLDMPGLAHFVEHCVCRNIPNREQDKVKHFFESVGGQVSFGSIDYLATRYRFTVPAEPEIFREALEIFGSMLLDARIEKEIEHERKIIYREFNQRYPFQEKLGWNMDLRRNLFMGHRLETYSHPLGRPEGFLSVTEGDLQCFYDEHYTPANMSLVVIGGFVTEEIIAELERSPFGKKKEGRRNPIPSIFKKNTLPLEQSKTVKLSDFVSFKSDQTEYEATWAFPADFPSQALRVFDHILGTILIEEIRQKRGLAYHIGSHYSGFHDVYEYRINGRISPEATPYIDDLVRRCISLVPSRCDVFERKQKMLIQKCSMIDLSGAGLCEGSADDLVDVQRIIPMQEVWEDLHKVTHEQMAEAASFLSSEKQYTFIICP